MKAAIVFLTISFIADQLLQVKSVRQTKHKDTEILFLHVLTWSIPMFIYSGIVLVKTYNQNIIVWWFLNTIIHFAVEWCCIRMWTYHFYDKNKSLVAFWILLEQFLINISMVITFIYFMG